MALRCRSRHSELTLGYAPEERDDEVVNLSNLIVHTVGQQIARTPQFE